MAMENSAPFSNDASEETPSVSKGDLAPLDAGKAHQRGEDASQEGRNEETEESKDSTDPEMNFEDAETVEKSISQDAEGVDSFDLKKAPERVEDGHAIEDENGSVESFDSALERIAVASTGEPASPEGPSSPTFQPAETPQQVALRQLNLWSSGVPSLDSSLLDSVNPTEFKSRVAQIAQSQGLSAISEDVENVFSALLPLVEEKDSKDFQVEAGVKPKDANDVSTADNGDGDNNVQESKQEVSSSHIESNGDVCVEQSDTPDSQAMEALDGDRADNSYNDGKNSTTSPDTVSEPNFPADSLKDNLVVVDAKGAEDGTIGAQVTKQESHEPVLEVIEWENSNESDADDLGNSNVEGPFVEPIESKESVDVENTNIHAAGLQQETDIQNEPEDSSLEDEKEGADLSPGDAVVDSVKELTEEESALDEAEGGGEKGSVVLGSTAQADFKEPSGDATDDVCTDLKADEKLPSEAVAEDVKNTLKELDADDGNAEASVTGSVQSGEQAHTCKGSEEDTLEGQGVDISDVEGLVAGGELLSAHTPEMKDSETSEPYLGQGKHDLCMESKSIGIENTLDASMKGEELVTEGTTAAGVPSIREESKASTVSAKGDDSEKEILSAADTKATTASVNDSASSLGGAGPSLPVRPAGLRRSVPSLEHAPRSVSRSSGASSSARQTTATNEENQASADVSEGNEDAREKLQMIRVKFLRLAHRLGQSAHNVVVAQVLYRLGLAEQLRGGRGTGRAGAFSFERASALAEEQEAAGTDDLEFGCTIMVLGKSGVGKSATINSLFDETKSGTNAYSPATNKVQEIVGTVHGIKLRVIDTPGLLTSFADQRRNERIMASVKRFIKKSPPDIVLYFDRLDMQSRDYGDLPLLRTITDTFGSAVWFNAIVVLTHASSAPPDGANGAPVSYEMFVAQRSHVVQQTIRQAAGDMRLMNPVSLVENHAACRRNRAGERVLPNGQVWKPQLLLLCFASKILAEANSLLKLQDSSPAKPFGVRSRVPPLPFLLSSLLQSRAQLKLPDEQVGSEDDESEDESDEEAESEGEEYDDLPPFRRLTKDELKLLDKEQRKTYAEELEYREKLFLKKQLKDERARKKELKRRLAALPKDSAQYAEESLEEENASASVPVPMPDMALPPSFDSDNPTYRYRYLDAANQWLVRPVLETHGWDHDSGYDGLNVEKMFVVSKKIPVSVSGQITKDKKEANLQMECAASFKNGEGKVTQAGLDVQTIGKDLAYTLRSETRFDNFKRNKTTCGLAVTLLGDTVAAGMKIEDRLLLGKRVKLVFNGGALTGRGDVAYGGSLEATIRDKDYPIGQFLSTFGLSVMDWHGDLAIGGNLQVQFKVGKTMTIFRGNLNNRRAGQVSIRVSSSEQLQMALIGLIPLLRTFVNNRILNSN